MKTFTSIAFILICAFFLKVNAANAEDRRYTMDDLKALGKSGSYRELYDHLKDIPPAKRDASWEDLVEQASRGLLDEATEPGQKQRLLDEMRQEYPSLKKSKKIGAGANAHALKDFEACYDAGYDGNDCTKALMEYVKKHGKDAKVALGAAKLVRHKMTSWSALAFYKIALDVGKPSEVCADPDLPPAIESGIDVSSESVLKDVAEIVDTLCWKDLHEVALQKLMTASQDAQEVLCRMALKRHAVSGLKEKKCKEILGAK